MGQEEVYQILKGKGWMTCADICEATTVSNASVHATLRRLSKSGDVEYRAKLVDKGNCVREYRLIL